MKKILPTRRPLPLTHPRNFQRNRHQSLALQLSLQQLPCLRLQLVQPSLRLPSLLGFSRIEDATGQVLQEVDPGTYGGFDEDLVKFEYVDLQVGQDFTCVLVSNSSPFTGEVILFIDGEQSAETVIAYYITAYDVFEEKALSFTTSIDTTIDIFPASSPTSPTGAPSGAPSAPTVSPAPSSAFVSVLVSVFTDFFPSETGWEIRTVDDELVYSVAAGTYTIPYTLYDETVMLERATEYILVSWCAS